MKALCILFAHIIGVFLLLVLGLKFNDLIGQEYAGVVTVLSLGIGLYSTIVSVSYNKSQKFHLFVNRLLLLFRRTHTYWQPHFHFEPSQTGSMDDLWYFFDKGRFGHVVKKEQTQSTLKVLCDDMYVITCRASEHSFDLAFDQKLLVPSHLYDAYVQKLSRLAEGIRDFIKPTTTRYGICISFEHGIKNPYYGFFVSRVPSSLLHTFQVSFKLDTHSTCRIEAGIDRVDIEGENITDTFSALKQVICLKAIPSGDVQ